MHRIYITSKTSQGSFNVGERTLIFKRIASILSRVMAIQTSDVGQLDIELRDTDLQLFKMELQKELESSLQLLEENTNGTRELTILTKRVNLNLMNDEHRLIDHLFRIFKMAEAEIKTSGSVYIFNVSSLDTIDNHILIAIKSFEKSERINFFYTYFISKYEQYADMSLDEFERRINVLRSNNFIELHDESQAKMITITDKSRRINF
jgi:hypothetical protein